MVHGLFDGFAGLGADGPLARAGLESSTPKRRIELKARTNDARGCKYFDRS